jgi:uncharacterized protein (UPF0276 family)
MTAAPPALPPIANRFGFPELGIGVGLRTVHYRHVLEQKPAVAWFEVISENYLQTFGRPLHILDQVVERYPVVMHGVSLSIGSTDPLDREHLDGLKTLADRTRAPWVSDHLCWTGVANRNTHDLLPMPYTEEALRHTAARIRTVQDHLGRPLILENPSTYVGFPSSTMTEWDFLAALCNETGAGLLLDVNNVYVSSRNHGFDPLAYLDGIPLDRVVQIHVAGHTDHGTHVIDTHIGPVIDPVWRLLGEVHRRGCRASILLEWDAEIPSFDDVHAEALRARDYFNGAHPAAPTPPAAHHHHDHAPAPTPRRKPGKPAATSTAKLPVKRPTKTAAKRSAKRPVKAAAKRSAKATTKATAKSATKRATKPTAKRAAQPTRTTRAASARTSATRTSATRKSPGRRAAPRKARP